MSTLIFLRLCSAAPVIRIAFSIRLAISLSFCYWVIAPRKIPQLPKLIIVPKCNKKVKSFRTNICEQRYYFLTQKGRPKMPNIPWYRKYDELQNQVLEAKKQFQDKCKTLGADPNKVFGEVRTDIIARIVHESNWQEGLFLNQGRTKELADAVFEALSAIEGPHIDMDWIVDGHKKQVVKLKRKRLSVEEIASYNLSSAHIFLALLADELDQRTLALAIKCLNIIKESHPEVRRIVNAQLKREVGVGFEFTDKVLSSNEDPLVPLTPKIRTQGELMRKLSGLKAGHLKYPMRIDYIHFLHRITMMGILPTRKLGVCKLSL